MPSFSWYPLESFTYENVTYFICPITSPVTYRFRETLCLSNSKNVTIATTGFAAAFMKERYGCEPIVSSMIPVQQTSKFSSLGDFGDLELTWNVPDCDCEDDIGDEKPGKSGWAKYGSPLFIPSAVVLVAFFGGACLIKLTANGVNSNNTTDNNPTENPALDQPQTTTGETTPVPPDGAVGSTENSKDKTCTESVVVHSESQGTSKINPSGVACPICLEEYYYGNHDSTVRCLPQCGHCFHAECIDLWLQKNTTCPVCRNSISN